MALALAQHNAPNLPAEHPINRVNPTKIYRNCTLHGQGSMGALKYGLAGQLKGYVFHACTVVGCNTLYKYTPEPVPDQGAFHGAHGALHAGAFAHHGAAFPGPPPPVPIYHAAVPHVAVPPLFDSSPTSTVPASGAVFCREGCRTAKGDPARANGHCRSGPFPRCKSCCDAKLRELDNDGLPHGGCAIHKHPASHGIPRAHATQRPPGLLPLPGSSPLAPVPILLPDVPPAPVHGASAPPPALSSIVPASRATSGAPAPSSSARGGLVQSLDLSWQDIQRSKTSTFYGAADSRARAAAAKTKEVMVVLWRQNDTEPATTFVSVPPPFRFSLSLDVAEVLAHWGVRERIIKRYRDSAWHDHVIDSVLDASTVQVFLFSVSGLVSHARFLEYIELLQSNGSSNASTARPNLKRLGEPAVSPLRAKKPRLTSPPRSTRARSSSPTQSPRHRAQYSGRAATFPPPPPAPLHAPRRPVSSPAQAQPTPSNVPIHVERDGMDFPSDFSVSNVVNAIHQSYTLSTARRLAREKPSGRMEVLSELLKTKVKSSTESDIRQYLCNVEQRHPSIYRKFMDYGHAHHARISDLRAAVAAANQALVAEADKAHAEAATAGASPSPAISGLEPAQVHVPVPISLPASPIPPQAPLPQSPHHQPSQPRHVLPTIQELLASLRAEEEEQERQRRKVQEARHVLSKYRIPVQEELDWKVIVDRISSTDEYLEEVIKHPMSHEYAQKLVAAKRAVRNGDASDEQHEIANTKSVKTAFFGPNLWGLILALTSRFRQPSTYSERALRSMRPLTVEVYYEQVLLRDVVLSLVEMELLIDPQEAILVYDASNVVAAVDRTGGHIDNDIVSDSDDDMPHAPIATTPADFVFKAMAEKRRRQLLQEEPFTSIKEEPLDVALSPVPKFSETVVDGKTFIILDD